MKIRRALTECLQNIDFLGPKIGFEHNSSSNLVTVQGGFYSLIVIVITSVVGGMFSQDFILRNNPLVINSQETVQNSVINLTQYPIFFTFTFNNVLSDEVVKLLDIDIVYFPTYANLTNGRTIYKGQILKKCNMSDYDLKVENQISLFGNSGVPGIFCLNNGFNLNFYNQYAEPNSAFINVRFKRCSNPGVDNCPANIDSLLQSISIGIGFLDSFIDSKNKTSPVQNKITSQNFLLSSGFLKRFFYRIRKDIYLSDDGWIFEDIKTTEYYTFQSSSTDYIINTDPMSAYYNHLYWATFDSPIIRVRALRSYMKVQDLFATLGGFARFISILVKFIVGGHLRFLYLVFLRDIAIDEGLANTKLKVSKGCNDTEASKQNFSNLSKLNKFTVDKYLPNENEGVKEQKNKLPVDEIAKNLEVRSGNFLNAKVRVKFYKLGEE